MKNINSIVEKAMRNLFALHIKKDNIKLDLILDENQKKLFIESCAIMEQFLFLMKALDDFEGTYHYNIVMSLYFTNKRGNLEYISDTLHISLSTLQRNRNKYCRYILLQFKKKVLI